MEAFEKTLDIARKFGDVALELRTLAQSTIVDFWHLRWEEIKAKRARVVELAGLADDPVSEITARFWSGITLLPVGDSSEERSHAQTTLIMANRLRDRWWRTTAFVFNEMVSSFMGDWEAAIDFAENGLAVSPSDTRLHTSRVLQRYQVGEFDEGRAYLDDLIDIIRNVPPGPRYERAALALLIPIVTRINGEVDLLSSAEDAANTVLSAESATPFVARMVRWGLAMAAVMRQDPESGGELYDQLSSAMGAFYFVSGDRVMGLLSQTMGDIDQAASHHEDALAFCRKAGYRAELAWTCCDYADALLERNGDGDITKARALLEEALSVSSELGMQPLNERATARLESVEAQAGGATTYPDGLTQREVEVLGLICGGKTDREIGEELFISVRTVGNHVRSILNKTGTANRTEAATYAGRHGLIDPESN